MSFCVLCVNILLTNIWTGYCILISIQCPNWDISHGKSLCIPWGKSAAAESHYPAKRHPLTPVENVCPASALALCLQTSVESVPEWRIDCLQFKIAVVLHILTTASCSVFKHNCPNALCAYSWLAIDCWLNIVAVMLTHSNRSSESDAAACPAVQCVSFSSSVLCQTSAFWRLILLLVILLLVLVHAELFDYFQCFHNRPNSDADMRACIHMWSFCVRDLFATYYKWPQFIVLSEGLS